MRYERNLTLPYVHVWKRGKKILKFKLKTKKI